MGNLGCIGLAIDLQIKKPLEDYWRPNMNLVIANLLLVATLPLCAQTAQDQGSSAPDVATTRMIRQGITKTKGMSMNARNITIVTAEGVVTLKGNVANVTEKNKIEAMAKKNAGSNTVKSYLEIAK